MADDQSLQIVIQAVDEASQTLQAVEASVVQLSEETQGGFALMSDAEKTWSNQMTADSLKVQGDYDNMANAAQEMANMAVTADEEIIVADEEVVVSKDVLGNAVERLGTRFIAHALLIGSAMLAYNSLKKSIDDAAKANEDYTKQFATADTEIEKQKIAIGNDFLPVLELLKQTYVDLTGKTAESTNQTSIFAQFVFDMGKVISSAMVIAKEAFQVTFNSIYEEVEAGIDVIKNFSSIMSGFDKGMSDALSGNWKGAVQDFSDTFNQNFADVSATILKTVDDTKKNVDELEKIYNSKLPKLSNTPYQKPDPAIANAMKTAADDYTTFTEDAQHDIMALDVAHQTATADITLKLKDLSTQYADTSKSAQDSLTQLAEAHQQTMQGIQDSINKTEDAITALGTKLADETAKDVSTLADAFVKAKDDVNNLQTELDNWQTPNGIAKTELSIDQLREKLAQTSNTGAAAAIQEQIDQQQQSLQFEIDADNKKKQAKQDTMDAEIKSIQDNSALSIQYADQIATAQVTSTETALQKEVDKFNVTQQLNQTTYNTQLAQLQQTLAAEQQKWSYENDHYNDAVTKINLETSKKLESISTEVAKYTLQQKTETDLYNEKVTAINALIVQMEQQKEDASNKAWVNSKTNLDNEIAKYKELDAEIKQVNSDKNAQVLGSDLMSFAGPHLAGGGIVTSPTLALIGEAGPEMVVPLTGPDASQSANIRPLGTNMGGVNVVVNVNGGVIDQNFVTKLGQLLTQQIKMSTATV